MADGVLGVTSLLVLIYVINTCVEAQQISNDCVDVESERYCNHYKHRCDHESVKQKCAVTCNSCESLPFYITNTSAVSRCPPQLCPLDCVIEKYLDSLGCKRCRCRSRDSRNPLGTQISAVSRCPPTAPCPVDCVTEKLLDSQGCEVCRCKPRDSRSPFASAQVCPGTTRRCGGNSCIDGAKFCDGKHDYSDGCDELACGGWSSPYRYIRGWYTYRQAVSKCASLGLSLPTFRSSQAFENRDFMRIYRKSVSRYQGMWLGLKRRLKGQHQDSFVWQDNSPATWTKWAWDQPGHDAKHEWAPNSAGSDVYKGEDCVRVKTVKNYDRHSDRALTHVWYDVPCEWTYPGLVCQERR